jgi:hypothetical protein
MRQRLRASALSSGFDPNEFGPSHRVTVGIVGNDGVRGMVEIAADSLRKIDNAA